MASQEHQQLHFILIPLVSPGHMIPMIDMARGLAERGVIVTIVTTTLNASRFKTVVRWSVESGLHIRLLCLPFPCIEAGLPEGCENADTVDFQDLPKFFTALSMLQSPSEQSLEEVHPFPSCIISDMAFPWTHETASKFKIPRLFFHGTCCLSLLLSLNVLHHKVREIVVSETEPFVVPGLPDRIKMTKIQLPSSVAASSDLQLQKVIDQVRNAELTAYGVIVNSFNELEPRYVEEFKKAKGKTVWCIGPVSLCNKKNSDKFERGNKASIDENECLSWLDSREPNSVIYACFGRLCRLIPSQMVEIVLGLEAANCPFIWVIRGSDESSEIERWLSEERFEERIKGRGLLIRGWAPHVLILSHPSIGGFLTHCGWNSCLEGVCAGVPMITWLMFSEQFSNEKLIAQILGIGVSLGINFPIRWGEEEKVGVLVNRDKVAKAVERLMDKEEGEVRRKRAMEDGGTSHLNITLLIQDIMHQVIEKQLSGAPRELERQEVSSTIS